jgi:CRP-like cAMP-binding protein
MAYYTGADFVEHSLLQAHDTLPWQLREVAAPTLLRSLPWARALNIGQSLTLADALRYTPAFSGLPAESLTRLAAQAKVERLPEQKILHRAGQTLRWARVIRAGRVELITHDAGTQCVARVLDPGALIGHDEILHNRPAETEARAVTNVELIRLPVAIVTHTLRDAPPRPEATLLSRIPLFRELPPDSLRRLAESLRPRALLAGEAAARFGEPGRELYLIGHGEFVVSAPDGNGNERTVAHLGPGEFFGEMALLRDEPRSATVRAISDAQVWSLSAADYAAFLRDTPALQAALEQVGSRRRLELRTA